MIVLQDCKQALDECTEALDEDFDVLAASLDGTEGVKYAEAKKPDFLLTSLVLKNIDGLEVLEEVREKSPDTKCVVLSNFSRGEIVKKAINLGAAYYMVKPVNYEMLSDRLKSLVETDEATPIERSDRIKNRLSGGLDERLSRIFISVGIPPHIKGYCYLREGIKLAVCNPDIINNITKKLYPSIGNKYGTTPSKVERAIRHAIEVAWNKGRVDNFNSLFGVRAYTESDKPTNSEFIALIADRMLLDGVS